MGVSVSAQTWVFLESCLLGIGLGILYDVFRVLRLMIPSGKIISFIEDVLYFTLCAMITFIFIQAVTDGELRAYIFIGELIGAVLYYFTVGAVVYRIAGYIIGFLKKMIFTIFKWITAPFIKLFVFLRKNIQKSIQKRRKKKLQNINNSKNRLKVRHTLLYNIDKYSNRSHTRHKEKDVGKSNENRKKK